jgi:cytoskeletal protein CcmA (bactofilin family)
VIGQSGTVHADVHTVDAVVMGTYEGNLVATGNVEITATGRVLGNIETDSLVIAKGGFFNGNVTKIREGMAGQSGTRPVYSLEDRRLAGSR